eukprot:2439356-Prymnesium_polylepis.2
MHPSMVLGAPGVGSLPRTAEEARAVVVALHRTTNANVAQQKDGIGDSRIIARERKVDPLLERLEATAGDSHVARPLVKPQPVAVRTIAEDGVGHADGLGVEHKQQLQCADEAIEDAIEHADVAIDDLSQVAARLVHGIL